MNLKQLFCLFCFSALLIFAADSVFAQRNSRSEVKNATWQTSVDDSERGRVVLGIRDKWGTLGTFNASFVVTGPNKKTFRGRTVTSQDDWAYINFPEDFNGNGLVRGAYTVVFYVNGVVIGRDKFKFRP